MRSPDLGAWLAKQSRRPTEVWGVCGMGVPKRSAQPLCGDVPQEMP